ncbi:MAG: hypothetical protein OXC57_02475 [Rhodobacteraceae bacterium]|nr:hypothetical protein [Paracoccaceae bacterium]
MNTIRDTASFRKVAEYEDFQVLVVLHSGFGSRPKHPQPLSMKETSMNLFRKTRNLTTSLHSWAAGKPLLQKMVPGLEGASFPPPQDKISLDDIEPWPSHEVEALLDRINPTDVGVVPKFCHHVPGYDRNWMRPDRQAVQKILLPFHEKLYGDLTRPGIHVAAGGSWEYILEDHPEIRFFTLVGWHLYGDDLEAVHALQGEKPLTVRTFEIEDWDNREEQKEYHAPSEENVRPLVDFLNEWQAAGSPSFLIRCAAGQYRSAATALAAHSMMTGDPRVSAIHLIIAGIDKIDSNWEIARIADPMLGFGGRLHAAALNVQRAYHERNRLLLEGTTPGELLERLQYIFENPWNEEQALAYHKGEELPGQEP